VAGAVRLGELAASLGLELEGDAGVELRGVAALESAGPADLAFVRSPRPGAALAARLAGTRAGALIAPPGLDTGGRPTLRSLQPALDFARAARHVLPPAPPAPGVHPSAWLAPDARVDASASIGPHCAIGAGAVVGPRCRLHAQVTLEGGASLGADCQIHAGCVIGADTRLGDRVTLHPGVVLGGDGFGYTADESGAPHKFPQLGRVVVEDDVEIGANTTVDRGALGDTRIGRHSKIDNLVQIGHNCRLGERVIVVAQAGLGGSTVVEDGAVVMAQAGLLGHLAVGERAVVGPQAGVHKDVPAHTRVMGSPQRSQRSFQRVAAALTHLPGLLRRVRALERRLGLRGPRDGGD
jgi:UDP-3-O-[3-hydroxymyristoyl] glucosamine N-acyltransferase